MGAGGVGAGSGGSVGSGGSAAGTGGSGTGGAGGSASGCFVPPLALVTPQVEENLISGKNARVRMRAQVFNVAGKTAIWKWTVEYRDVSPFRIIAAAVVVDADAAGSTSTAEFAVSEPGHYEVRAAVDAGVKCERSKSLLVNVPGPASYRFRVSPRPLSELRVPAQETSISLVTGRPPRTPIVLAPGIVRSFNVIQAAGNNFIPAYVRVNVVPFGVATEGHTREGPVDVLLLPRTTYDVMFVPDGDFAPFRLLASADSSLNQFNPIPLDQGILVRGSLVNSQGAGVEGARIVLRDGTLPSTIGISDANGKFSLWAREGLLSAVVVPSAQSGWPETRVTGIPGIPLDSTVTDLTLTWNSVVRGALSVAVKSNDGSAPVAGARVLIEAQPGMELQVVGGLRVTGAQVTTVPAIGAVRLDLFTDALGVAQFPNVPEGAYRITVVPPEAMSDSALTTRRVRVTRAGLTETIPLSRHLTLSGTLLPKGTTAGVRIIARDQSTSVVAPVVSAIVGAQGTYSLSVDPERTYQLVADPPPGSGLARTVLPTKNVASANPIPLDYTVAQAVAFNGVVTIGNVDGRPVGGALVQVFCLGSSLDCVDPEIAVAEAVTSSAGTFTVALPAPLLGP